MTASAHQPERSVLLEPPAAPTASMRRQVLGVCAIAFALFALVAALSYGPSYRAESADLWWNDLVLAHRTDLGVLVAWVPAVIGGPISMLIIGLALVSTFLFLRWKVTALTLAVAMVTSVAMAAPLAAVVAKTRPEGSLAESVPTSFPSGHTAMAATVAVIIGLAMQQWFVWLIGTLWVVIMALSRTYLQAHWLTDVLAGAFIGTIAGTLVWFIIETIRARRTTVVTGD